MVISKTSIYVVISTILFITASIIVVWQRVVINKTLDRISEMIDNALYRNFSHIEYDESKMSSIEVTDNGIGISEEDISRIFQRFYRAQKVQQEEGAGIGLYLARKILSEEGGYIKVSSKEGEGSKFTIFLPKES